MREIERVNANIEPLCTRVSAGWWPRIPVPGRVIRGDWGPLHASAVRDLCFEDTELRIEFFVDNTSSEGIEALIREGRPLRLAVVGV